MKLTVLRLAAFFALTVSLTVWIAGNISGGSDGPRYELVATFDDIAGMYDGDDVKIAGLTVGEVTDIDVVDGRARVTFAVDEDVPLPTDSVARVRWRNLIGQRFLGIEPGTATTMLEPGSTVDRAENVVDLGDLVNQLVPLAQAVSPERVNEILTTLLAAFDGNDESFDALVTDLSSVLGVLAERDATIDRLLADYDTVTAALASRDGQIAQMVDNLVSLTATFADHEQLLEDALVEMGALATDLDEFLDRTADDFGASLDHLAVLTGVAADNVDHLEDSLVRLPDLFEKILPTVNRGEWIRVSVLCVTVTPGQCPYPTSVSGGPGEAPFVFDTGSVLDALLEGLFGGGG